MNDQAKEIQRLKEIIRRARAAFCHDESDQKAAVRMLEILDEDDLTSMSEQKIDPYKVEIGGVLADPYQIAHSYGIDDVILFQALKKILRCGRKHKSKAQDVRDAITSLQRWEEIHLNEEG